MEKAAQEVVPILILVTVIVLVIRRLPKVNVGHSDAFLRRRVLNWLPLGLTYAFLYMARYNIVSLKDSNVITGKEFGDIDFVGSLTYGVAFLLNGPLADRWGGRVTILLAAGGALVCNLIIGIGFASGAWGDWAYFTGIVFDANGWPELGNTSIYVGAPKAVTLTVLYAINMYFQSFGAVSIVKVNSSWFHVRERGTFGGIFGILISLGLYFAFDWAPKISMLVSSNSKPNAAALFLVPALILGVFWVLSFLWVRDTPALAGLADFDVADASSGQSTAPETAFAVIKRLMTNKIIIVIALIELCSGFLRQGILKWYRDFASGVGLKDTFVFGHWGMVSCVAGITGGMFAGLISDHIFGSRRAPVSTVLYAIMLVGSIMIIPMLVIPGAVSFVIAFMAMAIIGVHGMLSGVASQDFGGRKNAGVATGLIDGFVYLGTSIQAILYGRLLPIKGTPAAQESDNWLAWPVAMIPVALIGLVFSVRLWNARVTPKVAVAPALLAPDPRPEAKER